MKTVFNRWKRSACAVSVVGLAMLAAAAQGYGSDNRPRLEMLTAPSPTVGKTLPKVFAQNVKDSGKIAVTDGSAKFTVVAFLSTRCPCTARYLGRLEEIGKRFAGQGVRIVGINSNANELPEDTVFYARDQHLAFPLLKDTDNSVARAFSAQHTPEVFVLDTKRVLLYHGAIDDSLYGDAIHHEYLRDALAACVAGKTPVLTETKAIGCGILVRKQPSAESRPAARKFPKTSPTPPSQGGANR